MSRPDANGTGSTSGKSLGLRKVVPGASCLLARMTRSIVVEDQPLGGGADEADAPEVVLFDPEEQPMPEAARPYVKVLVDKFLAAKLRPHQVAGACRGSGSDSCRAVHLWGHLAVAAVCNAAA